MDFSEADDPWRSMPDWAIFLVKLGYEWMANLPQKRRIAVVSMPSDSAAAGLITLGAMRKRLELYDANDLDNHFHRIKSSVQGRHEIRLRHQKSRRIYVPDIVDTDELVWVKDETDHTTRRTISRNTSNEWFFIGEAPVSILEGQKIPNESIYSHLISSGGALCERNFSVSDSAVCLAGSIQGEANTKSRFAGIKFRHDECESGLDELLTVHGWMLKTASRIMFFNSRTGEFDRKTTRPQVVIADGDGCFLRLLDMQEFEHSDVVGVIHRTMERERLERIGAKLDSLRQWYDLKNTPAPRGIAIKVLERTA